jgi:lysozyme family protein
MATFEKSQKIVGINEGGYQNDPEDDGNWYMGNLIGTNWGISAPTLGAFLGRVPTVGEMKNLMQSTAELILKQNYWTKNNFDKLKNQSVATMLYDGAVNHGVAGMRGLTEKALTILRHPMVYYQVFTPEGIEHMNSLNQKDLFEALKTVRANRYKSSSQKKFIQGWLNRLDRIKYIPGSESSSTGLLAVSVFLLVGLGLIAISL